MKIIKGTYKTYTGDGWKTHEGSYANCYPFVIHRSDEGKGWSLSHMATGYSVKKSLSLKRARSLAKYLQGFPLFLVPCLDTFTMQLALHKQQHPKRHQEMLNKITGE